MSAFLTPPVRPLRGGRYRIRLDQTVRDVLASLPEQMLPLIGSDDPLVRRLTPPAYTGDGSARDEGAYRKMVGDALDRRHVGSLELLRDTASATTLDDAELSRWLDALNTIRLVLGTRLDVSEDLQPPAEDDPDAGLFQLYELLSWLVAAIVDALSGTLPDLGSDDDPEWAI